MAYFFGDSFDLYAAITDAVMAATYWDSTTSPTLTTGRFTGSQGVSWGAQNLVKTSGVNDVVHHFNIALTESNTLGGTNVDFYINIYDGATLQCCVAFRRDGTVVLTTASLGGGTVLATSPQLILANNTWYSFEVEVVINNTTGSFAVRKNGNSVNDYSATGLNTRQGTTNNYANRIQIGGGSSGMTGDDFLWRSDASSVSWAGDLRCYARHPVSDVSVQWTPSGSVMPQIFSGGTTGSFASFFANQARFQPFVALCSGTIGSAQITVTTASTANLKAAIYTSSSGNPTTALATSNAVASPGLGTCTFTFPSPATVVAGQTYFFAYCADTTVGQCSIFGTNPPLATGSSTVAITYTSFPTSNPTLGAPGQTLVVTLNITPTGVANAPFVGEPQQDGATSYVYSSTVGQSDLYGLSSLSATPGGVIGVVTRVLAEKSDAGTRTIVGQLKSGSTTVQTTATVLNTVWGWAYRTDLVDPATGSAWTATAVNNAQIGVVVTA